MSGGEIAAIIWASGFVLLVLFTAIPLVKLGGLLDETKRSIQTVTDDVSPLLTELTETVEQANKQLAKVDSITTNVSEVTTNVSAMVSLFTSALGSPLVKIAGLAQGLRSVFFGKAKK
jgi:uncharacterized protein YoxC